MDLRRYYYINQIEYAQNIVFKRNHPIHSIFERSCDLGLARISTQRIANIFGWRPPLARRVFRCSAFSVQVGIRGKNLQPDPFLNSEH